MNKVNQNTLVFTLEYPPFKGGIANYYENLVKHWPKSEGNDIFVLHNNDNKLINKKLPFLKWLPSISALKKEVINRQINHVIVGNILPLGTVAYYLSKKLNFKYSVIIHGTDIEYAKKSWRKKVLAKKILAKADKIICNSEFTSRLVKELDTNLEDKIIVVNPGVLRETCNVERGTQIGEGKIVLFSISRLIKRKGIDSVIEIMPEILKKIPNLVYFIAGIGPDEEYIKKIAADCEQIKFLGRISDEEKWAWLKSSDIFVLPTRTEAGNLEGFGIVYLEANLAGKPVIAGNSGGVSDAVIDNVTGLMVDPDNNEEIKNAIIKLAKDKSLREKLGEQGRKRASEEFNWEKQIQKIYLSITNKS